MNDDGILSTAATKRLLYGREADEPSHGPLSTLFWGA